MKFYCRLRRYERVPYCVCAVLANVLLCTVSVLSVDPFLQFVADRNGWGTRTKDWRRSAAGRRHCRWHCDERWRGFVNDDAQRPRRLSSCSFLQEATASSPRRQLWISTRPFFVLHDGTNHQILFGNGKRAFKCLNVAWKTMVNCTKGKTNCCRSMCVRFYLFFRHTVAFCAFTDFLHVLLGPTLLLCADWIKTIHKFGRSIGSRMDVDNMEHWPCSGRTGAGGLLIC